jgi:hypothetical protein
VSILKFKRSPKSVISQEDKQTLREIYVEAARELTQLAEIIYDNDPLAEIDIPVPPGIVYDGSRGYHPDYTFQELWEITAGFQDPDPPTIRDRLLFEEGKLEL